MVTDPYKVLGVSRDATKEEIKKAYRQKGKECHPDLHPDDPTATARMAEINEAYDMLTNPEKYSRQQTSQGYGNSYGNPYGSYQEQGGFEYYDFSDLFGFGRGYSQPLRPTPQPGDSNEIRQAIDFINMGQYHYASQILMGIHSMDRDARWYYLNALTNYGLGNQILAEEQIRKAIQLDPYNETYQRTLRSMSQAGRTYNEAGQGYQRSSVEINNMCSKFCLAYFLCTFCRCC